MGPQQRELVWLNQSTFPQAFFSGIYCAHLNSASADHLFTWNHMQGAALSADSPGVAGETVIPSIY